MGLNNQKTIIIKGKEPCDTAHIYAILNKQALYDAAADLGPSAFLLWVYFASNQMGYRFDLSNVDTNKKMGLTREAHRKAVNLLIEKGYLVKSEVKGKKEANEWEFYEKPHGTRNPLHDENATPCTIEIQACAINKEPLHDGSATNITENTIQNKEKTKDYGRQSQVPIGGGSPQAEPPFNGSFNPWDFVLPYETVGKRKDLSDYGF